MTYEGCPGGEVGTELVLREETQATSPDLNSKFNLAG